MKASLKLLDDDQQRPLLRAKIPLTVVGLPFFSAVSAGSSASDLQIDLGTALPSGPSVRLSYRPNHPLHPFRLSLRSGAGPLGSPLSPSPLSFHLDFDPLSPSAPPTFSLLLKPRLGDFSLRKVTASLPGPAPPEAPVFPPPSSPFRALDGVELLARTVLPLRSGASVRFRWGVRVPADLRGALAAEKRSLPALPQLLMNKVSVEYAPIAEPQKKIAKASPKEGELDAGFVVRDRLDALKAENGMLRKAVEELRMEVLGAKLPELPLPGRKVEERNAKKGAAVSGYRSGRQVEKEDATASSGKEADASAELRKAIMAAAGGGGST